MDKGSDYLYLTERTGTGYDAGTMRKLRAKYDGAGYYHLVSRCAFKRMSFGDEEKSVFVRMMRKVAAFSGIEVAAFCIMGNHFHLLVHVPIQPELTEELLLERVAILYGRDGADEMKAQWEEYRKGGAPGRAEEELALLRRRMGDISPFMQCLKQRFSVWFRSRHEGHEGTLWQGRFSSTLVEGGGSLAAVAAYIDLNPVRAGIVSDPKDYRWSSYGAAMGGDRLARLGLTRIYRPDAAGPAFGAVAPAYRTLLYVRGTAAIGPEKVAEVLAEGGKLDLPAMLLCRIGYFTRGFAIGAREYVEAMVSSHPANFGPLRKAKAHGIGLCREWNGLRICAARRLRKNPVSMPGRA